MSQSLQSHFPVAHSSAGYTKERIMFARTLFSITFLTMLFACAPSVKQPTTVVNPSTVSLGKSIIGQDESSERTVRITINPSTAPAATSQPSVSIPFDGHTLVAPPGSAITFETHEKGSPAKSEYVESADAVGASLRSDSDRGDFQGSAPEVRFSASEITGLHGGAKGGASQGRGGNVAVDWLSSVIGSMPGTTQGVKWAWAIGLLCYVAAILYFVVQRVLGGVMDWFAVGAVAAIGTAIIIFGVIAERYPWVLLILFLVVVGIIGWYVWRWKEKESVVVVPGIANSNNGDGQ